MYPLILFSSTVYVNNICKYCITKINMDFLDKDLTYASLNIHTNFKSIVFTS